MTHTIAKTRRYFTVLIHPKLLRFNLHKDSKKWINKVYNKKNLDFLLTRAVIVDSAPLVSVAIKARADQVYLFCRTEATKRSVANLKGDLEGM